MSTRAVSSATQAPAAQGVSVVNRAKGVAVTLVQMKTADSFRIDLQRGLRTEPVVRFDPKMQAFWSVFFTTHAGQVTCDHPPGEWADRPHDYLVLSDSTLSAALQRVMAASHWLLPPLVEIVGSYCNEPLLFVSLLTRQAVAAPEKMLTDDHVSRLRRPLDGLLAQDFAGADPRVICVACNVYGLVVFGKLQKPPAQVPFEGAFIYHASTAIPLHRLEIVEVRGSTYSTKENIEFENGETPSINRVHVVLH